MSPVAGDRACLMKGLSVKNYIVAAILAICLAGITTGCGSDRTVVKKDVEDKPRLLGGRQYDEKTTYRNADGTYSTEEKKVKTP